MVRAYVGELRGPPACACVYAPIHVPNPPHPTPPQPNKKKKQNGRSVQRAKKHRTMSNSPRRPVFSSCRRHIRNRKATTESRTRFSKENAASQHPRTERKNKNMLLNKGENIAQDSVFEQADKSVKQNSKRKKQKHGEENPATKPIRIYMYMLFSKVLRDG